MKFSVLMSLYKKDRPEEFEKALRSVTLNQTVKPDEIVIVYDGVVCKEADTIIEQLQKKCPTIKYKVIRQKINKGLAAALNVGLLHCENEYVARMDADDISADDRFERQIAFMRKHPQVDVLGGLISEFVLHPGDINSIRYVYTNQSDILKMAKRRTPMNHVSVVYKRSKVLEAGGYDPSFGKLEDYKLWVDMLSRGYIFSNINEILVYVRVGNGFLDRRSDYKEIKDWDRLQQMMMKVGIIGHINMLFNMTYIRLFSYMPKGSKRFLYAHILRNTKI